MVGECVGEVVGECVGEVVCECVSEVVGECVGESGGLGVDWLYCCIPVSPLVTVTPYDGEAMSG